MKFAGIVGAKHWTRIACVALLSTVPLALTACQSDPDIDITKLSAETDPPDSSLQPGAGQPQRRQRSTEASRKFAAIDRAAPVLRIRPQGAGDERVRQAIARAPTKRRSPPAQRYLKLYPSPRMRPMRSTSSVSPMPSRSPSVTQDQRAATQHDRGDAGGHHQVSRFGICRGCAGQDPLRARPARRQGNAGRPLLSGAQGIPRRDHPPPHGRRAVRATPTRSRKRSRVSSKPIMQ